MEVKAPPYSEELEVAVLGAILANPSLQEGGSLRVEDFYLTKHRLIFDAMLTIHREGVPTDMPNVVQQLQESGDLEQAGGAYYVSGLVGEGSFDFRNDVKKLSELADRRAKRESAIGILQEEGLNGPGESATGKGLKIFPLTDAGQAEFFAHLNKDHLRFNHSQGHWFIWNGDYWQKDLRSKVVELAIKAARERQVMALEIQDLDKRRELINFGLRSENKFKIGCCLDIAKALPIIATTASDWDNSPFLLQFSNGLLDLSQMEFQTGNPRLMISRSTGYEYMPDAECPIWKRSIAEIMDSNPNLMAFLQRAVGYSLTGDVSEQCFFLLYGSGANGKSKTLEILRSILGDYASDSPFSAFERRYGNPPSNDLARLNTARLVTSAESGGSKRLDEERLKAITGGDPVTARFLCREFFTYAPQFKLWLAVNSLPKVEDFSEGFWRRVRLIPFEVRFDENRRDPKLIEKLKPELSGIMNWAIEGFQQWLVQGLNPPPEVIQATKDYQTESDEVAEFLAAFTMGKEEGASVKASDLYRAFCNWWESEYSGKPISQTSFGKRVSLVTGIKSEKIGGRKHYLGLQLIENQ
ncbi:MAG: hypothetical protein JSU77_03630 [Fidelibacterota bacterium]|nr:MAG: hypothetical protein JSU77_03630 [Candidatus Neomarinimicrobiota bacterium]